MAGKRSAGEIHQHFARMDTSQAPKVSLPQPEKLILINDRSPQLPYGETLRQNRDAASESPISLTHTKDQLLGVESAIPQAFLANGSWEEIRGKWVSAVHDAQNGKSVALLLEQLEAAMPPALFVSAWTDAPGMIHNRHFRQVKSLVDMSQRRKTTRKTPKELKELQRLQMEKSIQNANAAEERRRVNLGMRRQAARAKSGSVSKSPTDAGAMNSLAHPQIIAREPGQVGGRNSAWTAEEMEHLLQLVRVHGMGNWDIVATGLASGRSVGSITQKYYKLTRGDTALDGRAKKGPGNASSTGTIKAASAAQKVIAAVEEVYNEWDDPTVPNEELSIVQQALRKEKEMRTITTTVIPPANEWDDAQVITEGGKHTEAGIQEELKTIFEDDINEFRAAEAEMARKARRKPRPSEWDFDRPFKGWRWDIREHEKERLLYRELLTKTQVLQLARRGGNRKLSEFQYHLDQPEAQSTNPGAPPLARSRSNGPIVQDPVYQKVEYDNGMAFWGKMREDNGQEDLGAFVDDKNRKRMVQFVDGKMFYLSRDDAAFPVAQTAMKRADETPTQPMVSSPRTARAQATQQRLPVRRKLRAADTPILSAIGSWRYGVRRATTGAAAQLHLSCFVSAVSWARLAMVDICDRPLVGPNPENVIETIQAAPDPARECWMELAVRGTMDAIVHAVALSGEGFEENWSEMQADAATKRVLTADAIQDLNADQLKQVKRVDTMLAHYDRRRIGLEAAAKRTTSKQLHQQILDQQAAAEQERKKAEREARLIAVAPVKPAPVKKPAPVTSTEASTEASSMDSTTSGLDGERKAENPGGGSGSGRRKGSDWSDEELTRLVALVKEHGRADWGKVAAQLGTGRTDGAVHQKYNKITRGDNALTVSHLLRLLLVPILSATLTCPVASLSCRIGLGRLRRAGFLTNPVLRREATW